MYSLPDWPQVRRSRPTIRSSGYAPPAQKCDQDGLRVRYLRRLARLRTFEEILVGIALPRNREISDGSTLVGQLVDVLEACDQTILPAASSHCSALELHNC
jgi:hypothetical protein